MDFSNYLENKLIDATVRGVGYPASTKVYLALYTTDPTKENTGTEVDGASYDRQQLTMGEPSVGVSTNSSQVTYGEATTVWGVVGWVGIFDEKVGGNLLYFAQLDNAKNILTGDQLRLKTNEIKLTLT